MIKTSRAFRPYRLLGLLLPIAFSHSASAVNCSDDPVSGRDYNIVNVGSGLSLDVFAAEMGNGANVIQWSATGGANQRFHVNNIGNGYWTMSAAHSGKAVDVSNVSTADGANIHQWDYLNGNNQQWQLKRSTSGAFNVVSRNSGKSMTVANATNGGIVYQQSDSASPYQRWYFNPVDGKCGNSGASGAGNNTGASGAVNNAGVQLTAVGGNGYIDLSWTATGALSNVQIMRDTDADPSGRSRVAVLPATSRNYRDNQVVSGTKYWYWLKYDGNNKVTMNSNAGSATATGAAPTPAPTPTPAGDNGKLIGFAAQSGSDGLATTTGGGETAPKAVTNCGALAAALSASGPAVVQIPANTTIDCRTAPRTQRACAIHCPSNADGPNKIFYRVPTSTQTCTDLGSNSNNDLVNRTRNETSIRVTSDKTLEGVGANAKIVGGNLNLSGVRNVIIRNLTIEDVNPGLIEAGDGISMGASSHVWLDHLRFNLISDGHIDMYDSKNVTLSWIQFKGENPAVCGGKHHYTQIISNSQVTLHHNEWINISGRNPKIEGGDSRVHLFNNFWKNVTYFSIGVGGYAQARVEGNYFDNAAKPHWDNGNGFIDAHIESNRYTGISAKDPDKDNIGRNVFGDVNLYNYSLEPTDNIPNIVTQGAGPH